MASTCVPVEVAMCDEVICPGELPVGLSTLLSHGPCSLSAAHWRPHVRPLCTCSPSSPTQAPSRRFSMQWGRVAIPVNWRGAQHTPVVGPPVDFRPQFTAWFWDSPCARAGPKAAAVKDEGVGLPGKLGRAQHAVILLPDPCHTACENLSAHVQHKVTCQFPPMSSCCAQRQPEWSHCRL